jgi:shikimate dehydrogenase
VEHRRASVEAGAKENDRAILVALVGTGIHASKTPRLHEQEGAAQGLRYIYKLVDLDALHLDVSALPGIVTAAQRFGFSGLNVTHPCKQRIIPLLDRLSPEANAIGAVNTVVFENGACIGHNTDWWGFAESFRRELHDVSLNRIVLIGAGGAGAAVAHALLGLGAERLLLVDAEHDRARALAQKLCGQFGKDRVTAESTVEQAMTSAEGLVNATPVGMTKYPGLPVPVPLLRRELWVADIVYFPLETELLRAARSRGCRTMSGGGMAVFQAAAAFRLFTGIEPNAERMLHNFGSA